MLEAKDAYKRLESLKTDRSTLDSHWQEITDYFLPNKNTITRETSPGEKRTLQIYDSTGIKANDHLAGALHGMLTNPATYWFEFTTGIPELDQNDDVRKWLQRSGHICHEVMNGSNFQTEIHEYYLDLCSLGTAAIFTERDEDDIVRFSAKHPKDCWVDENNKGQIDTVYYVFKWKPRQIIAEFGLKKTPKFILDKEEKNPEEKIEILQVIMPNGGYSKGKKLDPIKGKKFGSCTYVKDGEREHFTLEKKGFNSMPMAIGRWSKGSGEVYGRSPAMICLSDVKMLQEMMKETIRAQQLSNYPPTLVPDDGIIGNLRMTPSGITYFRSGQGDFIKQMEVGKSLHLSREMLQDLRERIKAVYYSEQLLLRQGPQMTATETIQRTDEQNRLLGPLLGRQHPESLKPIVERVYEITDERGLIPPPPKVLAGRKVGMKYRSQIAKAQLGNEMMNLQRAINTAAPFMQIDQRSTKVINAEEGVRYVARTLGLPVELIRDKKEVQDLMDAEAEAQAEAVQAAKQQQGVEQAATLAPAMKTMSEIGAA
jgi:hypothetical protein